MLAALLHGSMRHPNLRRGTRNAITKLSQKAPPIFGRVAITFFVFVVPCGRLSWMSVSFSAPTQRILIVAYCIERCFSDLLCLSFFPVLFVDFLSGLVRMCCLVCRAATDTLLSNTNSHNRPTTRSASSWQQSTFAALLLDCRSHTEHTA